MTDYKAVNAPPYDGQPAWRGMFVNAHGRWQTVRNQQGNPICYASYAAAYAQAAEAWKGSVS